MEWVDSANSDSETTFEQLGQRIDVENFVTYFAINIVAQNHDWPYNNWIAARPREDGGKWRWFPWDSQWSFGLKPTGFVADTLTHASDPQRYRDRNPDDGIAPLSRILNLFLATDEGRSRFIERVESLLNWEMSSESMLSLLELIEGRARPDIPLEAERWASSTPYSAEQLVDFSDGAYGRYRDFFNGRPNVVRSFVIDYFDLEGSETVTLSLHEGCGSAVVNGREVSFPWTGTFFAGSEVTILAIACDGYSFDDWGEDGNDAQITIEAGAGGSRELVAEFDEE